jgi:RNA polymerase sigma-70 factor (ECF subfamily)
MLQDEGLAEDIAQEVFVTVFRSILSFNQQSSISTWIYRITVNKCLDHLRAKKRHHYVLFSQLFEKAESGVSQKKGFDHPGIQLEQRENARHLFKAIEGLPNNQKTIFILAHIEELPQKEIAEIMNMSLKAVESVLQRAKGNLRKKLSAYYKKEK